VQFGFPYAHNLLSAAQNAVFWGKTFNVICPGPADGCLKLVNIVRAHGRTTYAPSAQGGTSANKSLIKKMHWT
jgi:hypothetical protein